MSYLSHNKIITIEKLLISRYPSLNCHPGLSSALCVTGNKPSKEEKQERDKKIEVGIGEGNKE